ncbi:ABC transporter substrate-binding protein [Metapseudomonas otitidis]|uniref:ABC transporter substrate-binding protein n=1 Tax=Metapseudomonas otitidis TaxID=319939 RepID=UPI0013F66402
MPLLRILLIGLCLCCSALAHGASVVFLCPGNSAEPFWQSHVAFMNAAAQRLGMPLKVLYGDYDSSRTLEQARRIREEAAPPDYLVFTNEQYMGPEILRLFQGSPVKLFAINSSLTDDQQRMVGGPRERYSNWIGSLVANEEVAGYLLARALIDGQRSREPDQPLEMLAFSGIKQTPAAQRREEGLQRALEEYPKVRLRQLVYAQWSRDRAYQQALQLLRRYPQTHAVWVADDQMALGTMQAARELGRKPGHDLRFAVLNSSPEVLQATIDGYIDDLVGGHFTLGGWAMVLLHDYDAGQDFVLRGGKDLQANVYMQLDVEHARRLLARMSSKELGLDFRTYSALYNPGLRVYRFTMKPLLD